MNRKLIQLAGRTLVVSLPSKVTENFGLKKGDEVDIEETEGGILVKLDNKKSELKEIDISNYTALQSNQIGALYKAGYNKIKVNYNTPEDLGALRNAFTQHFVGFEITNLQDKYCIIEEIATSSDSIDTGMRRTFRLLLLNISESINAIKTKNKEKLQNTIDADMDINRFANYTRRILSKSMIERRSLFKYYIVEGLEKSGDLLKEVNTVLLKNNFKINENEIKLLHKYSDFVTELYNQYYEFKPENLNKFKKLYIEIQEQHKETPIGLRIYFAANIIYNVNGALLGLHS